MPKPATLPAWATDGTNNDEPSAGQKATGWTPGQTGVSDYDNWYKKLVYDWCSYLNSGALEGNHSIDGTLTVEDSIEVDAITAPTTGLLAVDGDIETNGVYYFQGVQTLTIPSSMMYSSDNTKGHNVWLLNASGVAVYAPIVLPVGAVILDWRCYFQKNTANTNVVDFQVNHSISGVDTGQGDAVSESGNATGNVTVSPVAAQSITIVAGRSYHLEIDSPGGIAPAADKIFHVEIDWNMPA